LYTTFIIHKIFFFIDDGPKLLEKSFEVKQQSMMLCKLVDSRLVNHIQSTASVSSSIECVKRCVKDIHCYSVNYQVSTGVCEINDVTDLEYGGDLVTGSDVIGFEHFTFRECSF